ncbi:MAG TPA: fasciclin domain-containing protein [Pyrinomonadaceae bacterium]|nr:fasciclin domain-containing protein [Pyrinomonadaceae bacterium]
MENNKITALNLIDTVAAHPQLSTFSQLLAASGIEEIFADGGDFTIFAPNNDAFRSFDPRRLLALLYDADRTNVRNLILFHVCMGRMEVGGAGAAIITAFIRGWQQSGGEADPEARQRNIQATNGVIHEIGTVLTPATSPCSNGH